MGNIDPSAIVAASATVPRSTQVWGLAQIRERAVIGNDCIIGRNAYLGVGVQVGDRVKVQNLAQIYEPAIVDNGCFVGPGVILTNDQHPRAVTPSGETAAMGDWTPVGVTVREGASLGARSVCVGPVIVGRWAMVAAGAVVVRDVPDFALVAGIPARQIGWVGKAGRRLVQSDDGIWSCPFTGAQYEEAESGMFEVDE